MHSLYIWGGVSAPALHASAYNQGSHLDYPLLLPGLEAVWLHVVGRYDGQLLHLQLVCFLGAFACGLIVLLRQAAARPPVRLLIVIAAVSSPEIVDQLVTNYADIPLAFFAALGLVSLVLWTIDGAPWLPVASLFLAAATLTKSEGAIFVGAAFVAAFLSRRAERRYTALGAAAIATAVPLLIWRAYTTSQHLTDPAYDPSLLHHPVALAHRVSRIGVAASGLAAQAIRWDFLLLIPIGGAVVAVAGKQRELVSFALRWTTISFLGLLVVYWISVLPIHQHVQTSADRLTASLVVGLLALAGVFSRDLPASAIASADQRVPPEFGPVEARIHAS
jgi:4-amino-4-deoxy-L-arabinose transferase-like glycosyltransferase